jgi:hypothetical protein
MNKKMFISSIIAVAILIGVSTSSAIDIINDDNYDFIIITTEKFSNNLQSFKDHKEQLGITTKIVTLDDIFGGTFFEVKGRDDQEKIKYFIMDALETWGISYILFVGNYKQIPVRYCYNNDEYASYETNFISELYYADIYDENDNFSSWDSDGDGIFGEWSGDKAEDKPIDLKPDVCLGRLACKNSREVRIMTNKIMNYEKQTAEPSWFKRMGVVGGDTYQEYLGFEGEIYNQMVIDIMSDFTPVKLWASNGYLTKNGWTIIKLINQGCGFIYLSGHGNPNKWATKTSEGEWIGDFNQFMMLFLINRHKLPVCLVGGCHNSQFDTDLMNLFKNTKDVLYHSTWLPECWSWRLTSHPRGGSIATIGSTGLCWYGIEYGGGGSDWLNVQFFREYANNTVILGQIWKNVLNCFIDVFPIDWDTPSGSVSSIDAKSVQEWVLLGDPTLKIGGYS